jgi:hypothetical protein
MADNTYSKMLESLTSLIAFENTLDLAFLDPPPDLTPTSLTTLKTEATTLHNSVGNSKGDWRTVALDRATDADELASVASQAVALLESRGARKETIEDARFYVRKLQGKRKEPKPVDDPSTPNVDESQTAISASQQSNAARISTFLELVDFLEAQPEYGGVTREGFKPSELRDRGNSVQTKHDGSITAVNKLTSDRTERDKVFFDNEDSILNRSKRFKKVVAGAYGFDSPEYRTANGIPFSNK